MVGESGTSKTSTVYRYYKCVGVKKHSGCDKKTVKKDWIEDFVVKQIEKVLFDDVLLGKIADTIMEIQGKENTVLPMLRKQYADIQRGIDNLLNAIQQGIITPSTKQRLEDLEKQKNDLSVQIIKEEMAKPLLTKDQILFWFHRFRKYNTRRLDHKRRLIDSFINTIYLYDDKMVITFNYKDGSETISLSEIENSDLSSDLTASALPMPGHFKDDRAFTLLLDSTVTPQLLPNIFSPVPFFFPAPLLQTPFPRCTNSTEHPDLFPVPVACLVFLTGYTCLLFPFKRLFLSAFSFFTGYFCTRENPG